MNILTITLPSTAFPHFHLASKTVKFDFTLHRLKTMKAQAMKTVSSAGRSNSMTSVIASCTFCLGASACSFSIYYDLETMHFFFIFPPVKSY